ncbi:hypothetical protein [Gilvimarinus xylanilyticus]|uniref:Uncharacterized protein n=1 Tax=Gilvimarinus xylanilyticus TaxID=2944139 RepID=A0A9X2I6B5_9GAMM|nr:hypothetical protein [Gilvimarinus xylanilyticus]MCP8900786.1 hypothetical protein [Gilvimarinus xylanilyticus]
MLAIIKKIKRALKRRKRRRELAELPERLQHDTGVRVTRIRLPSGAEIVCVDRDETDESL